MRAQEHRANGAAHLPRGVVLMNAGYGTDPDLRTSITALGLSYVAGIRPQTSVWAPGTGPRPPKAWSGHGRPPKLLPRDGKHQTISVKKLVVGLPTRAWRKIMWRDGTADPLPSRFARVRVRAAHRDYWLAENRPEQWLLIEMRGERVRPSTSIANPFSVNRRLRSDTTSGDAWRNDRTRSRKTGLGSVRMARGRGRAAAMRLTRSTVGHLQARSTYPRLCCPGLPRKASARR